MNGNKRKQLNSRDKIRVDVKESGNSNIGIQAESFCVSKLQVN